MACTCMVPDDNVKDEVIIFYSFRSIRFIEFLTNLSTNDEMGLE